MIDGDLRDQIVQLENEIDQLAHKLETCRKVMWFSKAAIVAGAILLLAYFLGAIGFDPASLIGALGAMIGGVVLLGSNSTTAQLAAAAMKDAEKRRAELIDRIAVLTVGGDQTDVLNNKHRVPPLPHTP